MRCKHCGAEIIRIHTMGGLAVCWASPITYWPVRDSDARELLTPNGNRVYGNLTGELKDFDRVVAQWRRGEITATEAMRTLKMSKSSFYRRVKQTTDNSTL